MSVRRIAAVTGLAGFALVANTAAQGLGDTAARERAKRAAKAEAQKEPAKVFTNDDLSEGRPAGAKSESSEPAAAPGLSEDRPASQPAADDRLAQERPLLDAIGAAQQRVTGAQAKVQELAEKLNPMSLSYIYGAGGSNDANEELRVRQEMRQAESELQAARQALVKANQDLQGQRQGRPPGPLEER